MTKYRHVLLSLVISPYLIFGAPTISLLSSPAEDTLSTYYCNDSPHWSGPSFCPYNCATAMSQFFAQKLLAHEDALFEFVGVGAQPQTVYPSQSTPLKFTYRTCTMAIVMLAAFFPEELPGVPTSTVFPLEDVASFKDAWNAVKQVKDNCISRYLAANQTIHHDAGLGFRSQTGWNAIGRKGAIGVFLWETNSQMDRRINAVNLPADSDSLNYAPLQLANMTESKITRSRCSVLLNVT